VSSDAAQAVVEPSLSGELSQWAATVTLDQIPADVIRDAKLRMLDTVGVAVAGSATEAGQIVRDGALAMGGGGESRILGYGDHTSPGAAAIANGVLAHIHDYDDTHSGARIHISNPIVSTVLSLGDVRALSGSDALLALIVGAELTSRLGVVEPAAFHSRGFHTTGVIAAIGAAFASAKILRLSPRATQNAIGIAASQAAGISECFSDGTWTKRFHPGWAAHCGITAATFAQFGYTGPAKALDGARGLFSTHLGAASLPFQKATEGLGRGWLCARSSFKPYPCGHVIHGFIDAILMLQKTHNLRPEHVAKITCPTAKWMMPLVGEPRDAKLRPDDEAFAKISLYFSVAAALMNGGLDLHAFDEDKFRDPRTLALADKVFCTLDPDAPPDAYKGWVIIETTDGRRLEQIVPHSLGSDRNFMSVDDLRAKFCDNLAYGALATVADRLYDQIDRLDHGATLRDVIALACRT
jgi:2-methylcitrate dehydratase PrpD